MLAITIRFKRKTIIFPLLLIGFGVIILSSNATAEYGIPRGKTQHLVEYKPLCRTVEKDVTFPSGEYEYDPAEYKEQKCVDKPSYITKDSSMCHFPGFDCVNLKRPLVVMKRKKGTHTGGWQRFQRWVPFCQCMLPLNHTVLNGIN